MTKRSRLEIAFNLEKPDRPPIMGGWLAAPDHIQTLTGCSDDEYWSDPVRWGIQTEKELGSDGVMGIYRPKARGDFRLVNAESYQNKVDLSVDEVVNKINAMSHPDEIRDSFDEEREYAEYIAEFKMRQVNLGDILWCPCDWWVVPKAINNKLFGYEGALMTMGLHPDLWEHLIRINAEKARQKATLRARAIREGISPIAFLTGEDICSQMGPMLSPEFLRKVHFPLLEYAIEPLLEVGARLIWHCDGDYRMILDDVLACGFGGLQGFQSECGMDISWISKKRTRSGDPLIILGPVSVTKTLVEGRPDDVRKTVKSAMEICRDEASLIFFTSNTINPDIPLENITTLWETVKESRW